MINEPNFISFHAYCPSSLLLDKRISESSKITYLMISSMLQMEGYCFPSNEWLVDKRQLDLSTVKDHLNELEESGYIVRETFHEGFKKKRRIWQPEAFRKYQENSKNLCGRGENPPSGGGENQPSDKGENTPYNIQVLNNKNKREGGEQAPKTPPIKVKNLNKEISNSKKEYGAYVKLYESEYKALSDEYGQEFIDRYIQDINNFVPNRKQGVYKDYAAAIRQWITKDKREGKKVPVAKTDLSSDKFMRNKKICEEVERRLSPLSSTSSCFQALPTHALLYNHDKDVERKYEYDAYEPEDLKKKLIVDCSRYLSYRAESLLTGHKASNLNDITKGGMNVLVNQYRSTEAK